ncbi:hypothetical protein OS145_02885 [Idiomarina baltica OS145]|uniref:Uncharacterized protein n=1 Tax=Idiomarina baltica OS145 TaxID=314276 RepID=A0ABM9WQJ2_9GAMM|nr:hypothetical protein OS145_02885 [Idiomarina baltica OS145]
MRGKLEAAVADGALKQAETLLIRRLSLPPSQAF